MVQIQGFRGLRYDLGRVGSLADVIAPPYDVIGADLSRALHAKSDHNAIRLILNPEGPNDTEEDNRYTRAARTLKNWRHDGVLAEERDPAIYAYFQTFEWEGRTHSRRGFMARVRLEPFGAGKIYPHEETMSGPKADRLKLFHATGTNLSQIFGLYPDDENEIADHVERAVAGKTPLEAVDHLNVKHQLWPVTDAETITHLQGLLGPKPAFIADGHHRYETGLAYLEERRAAGALSGPDDPANFILMMLVGMNDPGLQVMPTHRLVNGVGDLATTELQAKLAKHFDVEVIGTGREAGRTTWESIVTGGRQDAIGLVTMIDDTWLLATLRSPDSMNAIVSDHSEVWKSLGVSVLHRLVVDHCLEAAGSANCEYVHLVDEVFDAVEARRCQLGCLVQSATVDHIRSLAGSFEKMPPKSTYFYPKLASGLVFNPIR